MLLEKMSSDLRDNLGKASALFSVSCTLMSFIFGGIVGKDIYDRNAEINAANTSFSQNVPPLFPDNLAESYKPWHPSILSFILTAGIGMAFGATGSKLARSLNGEPVKLGRKNHAGQTIYTANNFSDDGILAVRNYGSYWSDFRNVFRLVGIGGNSSSGSSGSSSSSKNNNVLATIAIVGIAATVGVMAYVSYRSVKDNFYPETSSPKP
jgi:hypothetical protein